MRNFMIMAGFVFGLGACGGGDKFDDVLNEMDKFKTKMCACTDQACTDKVQDEWREYRKGMKDKIGKDSKPSEAQDKRGRAIDEEMRTCRRKHEKAEGAEPTTPPATPPAAEGSAAAPAGSADAPK